MIEYYKCIYCDKTTEFENLYLGLTIDFKDACVCKDHKDRVALYLNTQRDWEPHIMPKSAIVGKGGWL